MANILRKCSLDDKKHNKLSLDKSQRQEKNHGAWNYIPELHDHFEPTIEDSKKNANCSKMITPGARETTISATHDGK